MTEIKQLQFFQSKHNSSTTKMFPKYLFALCALFLFAAVANVSAEEEHDFSHYSEELRQIEELPVEERNPVSISNLTDTYTNIFITICRQKYSFSIWKLEKIVQYSKAVNNFYFSVRLELAIFKSLILIS